MKWITLISDSCGSLAEFWVSPFDESTSPQMGDAGENYGLMEDRFCRPVNFRMAQVHRPMLLVLEGGAQRTSGSFSFRSKLPYVGPRAARLRQSVSPSGFSLDFRRGRCEKESAATG